MKLFLSLLLMLCLTGFSGFSQSKDVKAIEAVMRLEEKYWNAGDIEAYVSLYAPGDSTRMLYSSGATYGKDSILAFYKKYWPKERMGTLKLVGDSYEKISSKYYYVSGFFEVSYPDKKAVKGRFSGLMKKINGRWYLYTDHSS